MTDREESKRREHIQLAALMFAEHFGKSDWQRFRSRNLAAFYLAKIKVEKGPPELRVLADMFVNLDTLRLCFEYPRLGQRRSMIVEVSLLDLDDEALDIMVGDAQRVIERDSGIKTHLSIRTDREAYEHHLSCEGESR